jgi:CHAT domain-containing protein/tetratricopeptide (TPR) repeat protein
MKFSKISSISIWKFAISLTILLISIESFPLGLSVALGTPQSLAQTLDPRKVEADKLLQQGIRQNEKGLFSYALKSLQAALKIYQEIKDRRGEAYTLGNIGVVYHRLGDYPKAINYQQQLLTIAPELKDRDKAEIAALLNLGNIYTSLGNYPTAIYYSEQSLAIAQKTKDFEAQGKLKGNLGLIYIYLGDDSKAIEYLEQSLEFARQVPDPSTQVSALTHLGNIYLKLANYPEAARYQLEALKVAQKNKQYFGLSKIYGNIAIILLVTGNYREAIEYEEKSLKISQLLPDPQNESFALANLGQAYSGLENYQKAIQYTEKSLAIARRIGDLNSQSQALNNIGLYQYNQGKFATAENTLSEAIRVQECIRGNKECDKNRGFNDNQKISIFDTQRSSYMLMQKVLVAQNKTDAALEIAERGRARAFVELLAAKLSPNTQQQSPQFPTIEEIKQIAKTQNATLVQYSIIYDDFKTQGKIKVKQSKLYIWVIQPTDKITFKLVDITPLQQQNTSLENLITDTLTSIAQDKYAVNPTRGNTQPIFKIGDRVRLKDDMAKDTPWIVLGVNSDTLTLRQPSYPDGLTSTYPIADVVEKVGANGSKSSANAKNSNLQQLHRLLIEPIANLLPTAEDARIIFIPQQELFAVPFSALQDSTGRFLIEKHPILTAPSIQVLQLTHQQRQRVPSTAKDVLLVGNPIMPSVANKSGDAPQQLPQLPGTAAEVKAIASLFQANSIIGKDATKQTILPLLAKARIAHFATHGILDDIRGLGSAIALTPTGNDNGLLTAEEIFDLKLNADLVVISACNTGKGRITGDGVIGLSRSLMNAGVPSLVVSLWSVNDRSTTTLMTEFYRNLQQKKLDKARSLQKAMQSMIQNNYSPYDWAAFNLIGNAE